MNNESHEQLLERIAAALERLAPPALPAPDWHAADAFIWHTSGLLQPVARVSALPLALLLGIEMQRDILLQNTRAFAGGKPANNALLWGARGTGKSSLIKAVHQHINQQQPGSLALVEIHRGDIATLPQLLALLRSAPRRIVLFCDDLSFNANESAYKSLKAVLEGGIEGRPDNVVFYATSNRRHLMSREMIENEQSTAINPGEAVEENVSLSDRFGLWLGFHHLGQPTYLSIVEQYAAHFDIKTPREKLFADALAWSITRGSRSGRVAWQFVQSLLGQG